MAFCAALRGFAAVFVALGDPAAAPDFFDPEFWGFGLAGGFWADLDTCFSVFLAESVLKYLLVAPDVFCTFAGAFSPSDDSEGVFLLAGADRFFCWKVSIEAFGEMGGNGGPYSNIYIYIYKRRKEFNGIKKI